MKSILQTMVCAVVTTALALPPQTVRAADDPTEEVADEWSQTFTAQAMGSHLGANKPNVMVVAANEGAESAAAALRAALRASKRAGMVMPADSIGEVAGLDDRAIVERAKDQPVGLVAVVRVFPSEDDEPASTVVSFYRPDGSVAVALAGTAGTPIAGSTNANAGVTSEAAKAIAEVEEDAEKDSVDIKKALKKYRSEYLWVQTIFGVDMHTGVVVNSWSQLRRGNYGTPVRGRELYQIIGREDLYKRYNKRHGVRFGVGAGMMLAGAALMASSIFYWRNSVNSFVDSTFKFGVDDPIGRGGELEAPSVTGGYVLLGVGGAMVNFGAFFMIFFRSHPVNKDEAAGLVNEYNEGLRQKYKIPDEALEARRVRVRPVAGAHNGLVIEGRF